MTGALVYCLIGLPFSKVFYKREFYLDTYLMMYIAFCCPAPSLTGKRESPATGLMLPDTALHTGTIM